jgi:uncharacterized repeat protein (TIGR03803 family)
MKISAGILMLATSWFALTVAQAKAQTYEVIHDFAGGGDGAAPHAGLTMDTAGNLYGTGSAGGPSGNGVVFRLNHKDSDWILTPLYSFQGGADGSFPSARVTLGRDGELYGTTTYGGQGSCNVNGYVGCGTVYVLRPSATPCKSISCEWTKTTLYSFTGGSDGANPQFGDIVFDRSGNVYGSAPFGGISNSVCSGGCGVVYELTPSRGHWTQQVLYSFTGEDGGNPYAGLTFDASGKIYGTTWSGGAYGNGTVYELRPAQHSWTESVIHSFNYSDGILPVGGVIFDAAGNLYGTTSDGPTMGVSGTAYELISMNGSWGYSIVYDFPNHTFDMRGGPYAGLTMDAAGEFYGTTTGDGDCNDGSVFRLMHSNSGWTENDVHAFCASDGLGPVSNVTIGANGNLYGTASSGGLHGAGVVWEITP